MVFPFPHYILQRGLHLTNSICKATPEEVATFFAGKHKQVLTFVGYSAAQYEYPAALLQIAQQLLRVFEPTLTIVNIGATVDGIGAVYSLAKRAGFVTTGIVSTQALEYDTELSPYVDYVFYIEDKSWGGFIDDQTTLSPTSMVMVQNSDVLIAIGGGATSRDELVAARRLGKDVRYIPADLNHQIARDQAKAKGLPPPTKFSGAVGEAL